MPFAHTALQCFTAVARHHGVDLAPDRLAHDHALEDAEPATDRLLRIAAESGFKARAATLSWEDLLAQPPGVFPLLLRLKNGNTVVATAPRADAGEVLVADPLASQPGPLALDRGKLPQPGRARRSS